MQMKVLVACEFSGVVRDAFLARGHRAISCDLLPSERPGPHFTGDVLPLLRQPWDLVIAHPPCTRLCLSGVRWLHERQLWRELDDAACFFLHCLNANSLNVAVENPKMHRYAKRLIGVEPTFSIQPWQFGHEETKGSSFWTRGLPALNPTRVVSKRRPRAHWEPPHADRWKRRSVTLPGIAQAMAEQWGNV